MYTMSFILDLNCNSSYFLLAQFVLTISYYSNLDVIEIAHKTISFHINKPSTTIVHIVDIFIYIYIGFFFRKSLFSLWLYTKSYSVLSLTTSRWTLNTNQSINQQVFLWLCCTHLHLLSLQTQKSSPWLNIHILVWQWSIAKHSI